MPTQSRGGQPDHPTDRASGQARPPLSRGVVLRGALFAVAMALGAFAAWLIVTSTDEKGLRIGILAGLWGLLLGCFALFGSRRAAHGTAAHPGVEHAEAPYEVGTDDRRAVELHRGGAVERTEDADARRAWERQLEQLLRGEIRESVNREVSALRAEVASLRGELLEKVGGQLRLERIETTRVIGSDLEALQEEVRQLKFAADGADERNPDALFPQVSRGRPPEPPPARPVVLPAQVRPVSVQTDLVQSAVQPSVAQSRFTHGSEPADEPLFPPVTPAPAAPPLSEPDPADLTAPIAAVRFPEPPPPSRLGEPAATSNATSAATSAATSTPVPPVAAAPPAPAVPTTATGSRPVGAPAQVADASPRETVPAAPAPSTGENRRPATPAARPPASTVPAAVNGGGGTPANGRPANPAVANGAHPANGAQPPNGARPANGRGSDPLSGLPRITPFTDFELDPIETPAAAPAPPPAAPAAPAAAPPVASGRRPEQRVTHRLAPPSTPGTEPDYRGRRRADSDPDGASGRHADRSTGRRRREDGIGYDPDADVLSRLLSGRSSR